MILTSRSIRCQADSHGSGLYLAEIHGGKTVTVRAFSQAEADECARDYVAELVRIEQNSRQDTLPL